ncbi:MAG: PKD domain-containing protein [Flavobacteriales bacterium]|nr:PKD domain-containing protein [Flavobacteriales bacterium]
MGRAPLSYVWSGSSNIAPTTGNQTTLNVPVPVNAQQNLNLTVTMTDDTGCVATATIAVTVRPTPRADLNVPDGNISQSTYNGITSFALCGTGDAQYLFPFTDASTGTADTYVLNWGDASPVLTNSTAGWQASHTYFAGDHVALTYTVTNTASNCSHVAGFVTYIGSNPAIGISSDANTSICAGGTLPFYLSTQVQNNPPGTEHYIDFGDGTPLLYLDSPPQPDVAHTFLTSSCGLPGNEFTVMLHAVNACETRSQPVPQIRVSEAPRAAFSLPPDERACVGTAVSFINQSTGSQAPQCGAPRKVWSISPALPTPPAGLGSTNNTQPNGWTTGADQLVVTFPTPGDYCVKLLVGSNLCGRDSVVHCICIEEPMQPGFTPTPQSICVGNEVLMADASGTPDICSSTLLWNITQTQSACGGGAQTAYVSGTSNASISPRIRFDAPGVYSVEQRQTNSCGVRTATHTINVGAPPQVTLGAINAICAGGSITPQATFTACGTPITGYDWTFQNGSPGTVAAQVPGTITYATSGQHWVRAAANSACGNTADSVRVNVSVAPAAPIVPDTITVCPGESIVLQATPVSGVTFTWSGPNNFSSTQTAPTIPGATAAMAGPYTVTPASGGCTGPPSTVFVRVEVVPAITITPSQPSVCAGDNITFNASGASNLVWTLDGNQQGTEPSVTITPTQSGSIMVTSSGAACPVTASMPFTVNARPTVDAGPARIFCNSPAAEVMQPVTPGGTWSGPRVTSAGAFTPNGVGTDTLYYTVVSAQNCSTTVAVQVRVDPLPPIPVVGNDTLVCLGTGSFQLAGSPSGGTWTGGSITAGGLFTPDQVGQHTLRYTMGTSSCAVHDDVMVEVVPAEIVTVGADFVRCISAAAVPLTASPAGGTWEGEGVSGTSFSPMLAGPNVGQGHALVYSRRDPNGCTSRDTLWATVHPLPVVDAGDDITFCDQPFPQQLSGYSPLNGTWAGAHVNAAGVFTPNGTGQFTLTYTYADILAPGNLCVDSAHVRVTVIEIDNPADAGPDREVCIGAPVLNLSGSPVGGTWSSVVPGSPWITAAGAFTPGGAGDHELVYSEGTGSCVTMDLVTITVHPLPILAVTSAPEACPDGGLQTATATPVGGWWTGTGIVDSNAGSFDPALTGEGSFQLRYHFTDANGCTDSTAAWATVNPMPEAGFTHAPIACAGAAFPFADASNGNTTWNWRFGDGGTSTDASPQHVYGSVGTYEVMLTVGTGAGCRDSIMSTVEVWEGPSLGFTAGPELDGCAVLNVEFDNSSTGEGLGYFWDLGNGTTTTDVIPPPVGYPASLYRDTTYTITLVVTNLCASVDSSVTVIVHPSPTALFGPDFDTGCSPWPVTFSNVSIGEAESFHWDFGDGSTLTTMDSLVTHTYTTGPDAVTRQVTLIATNACGSDTATYTITVQPNSITAFFNTDTTSGCSPLTVNFTQYSIGVTNWHWDLGDGNVSTAQHVSHTYGPGTWLATLYGDNQCSYDTVSVVIEVSPSPQVAFAIAPQPVCAGDEVSLTNLTSGVAGTTWDLGDGNTSTLSILTHTYAAAGTYDVTLNVVAIDNGCPASLMRPLVVAPLPVAVFTVSEPVFCAPATLLYTNNSQGSQLNSTWYMDGAVFSHLFHPLPQQTTATGSHVVSLVVADPLSGCRDSTSSNIMGYATPEASFILEPVDPCGDPAVVLATNTSSSDALVSWWLDGALLGTQSHLVASLVGAGEHIVELVAEMPGPCLDTARTSFTLHQLPIPAFTTDTACVGQPIPIVDESLYALASWWYFNDTLVGTDPYTGLVPIASGPDTVKVVVMGEGGCLDSLTRIVRSYPTPFASYLADVAGDCETVQLVAPEHHLMAYEWEVDGRHWSNDRVTRYHYGTDITGTLHIALRMTNIHGCADTEAHHWEVPSCVYVPNTFTPDGDLVNDVFGPSVVPFAREWHMHIFDRWGRVVKELRPADPMWKGDGPDGAELPIGVYNWRMTHVEGEGVRVETKGHVNLVR